MVFGLDIGTRTIVGILASYDEITEKIIVHHFYEVEHENRAMIDGQIHDVARVAKGVAKVKKALEDKSGKKLNEVAIAIAGRFLISSIGTYSLNISEYGYLSSDVINKMEIEAVNAAAEKLQYPQSMYCVGYSVLYYSLDNQWMKHLEGQKGNQAKVKVLAAFLPSNVVEAMLSVLDRVNLKPMHITLEPIAATSLVVPEDLRNLNIAMIDIGAGTSDIAISDKGIITGYGMVPKAGDEITDVISEGLLVDFKTAESIKRQLKIKETISFLDILDNSQTITKQEVLNLISPVIDDITEKIAKEIINLNGKPPIAVMIVGGGGKVPLITEKLAEKLGIPNNRVSLKTLKNIDIIFFENEKLEGSEYITPLGIVNVALKKQGSVFTEVKVNGRSVNMLMIGKDITILQVLLQAGYSLDKLVSTPSLAIAFELNGKLQIKRGNFGKKARIFKNGEPAELHSTINPGDIIEIEEPRDAEPVTVKLTEVIKPMEFFLNGVPKKIYPIIYKNGERVEDLEELIQDGDEIQTISPTIEKVFKDNNEVLYFTINNLPYEVVVGTVIVKNDEILENDYRIQEGDLLRTQIKELPKIKDFLDVETEKMVVYLNGEEVVLDREEIIVTCNGNIIDVNQEIKNGSNYTVRKVRKEAQLIDILSSLSLNIDEIKSYDIYINDQRVESFLQKITPGANVRLIIND
ncbi:MAG TPA: cell division FtsA domain-containing protein [Defluviitoga tunisiensis]|nr:cell division FtsA domain-containing protein [Defluviitoga tunisiensis]HOL86315.1 cell division FtsA domain-containing protein [Defluviitoga tunisiensis]HPP09812.1 cell division FtsA domain-containing protein [Defluviitoga tunisiensis]